jgi:hypothetical protein
MANATKRGHPDEDEDDESQEDEVHQADGPSSSVCNAVSSPTSYAPALNL